MPPKQQQQLDPLRSQARMTSDNPGTLKEDSREPTGGDKSLKKQSLLLQLDVSGHSDLLLQVALLLSGQDLLHLRLTSAHLSQWVRRNVFESAAGRRAIEAKARRWFNHDLASFDMAEFSCEHGEDGVDAVWIDSQEVILTSHTGGLTLFDRRNLKHIRHQSGVLNSNLSRVAKATGKACFDRNNLVLPPDVSSYRWKIVDRTTLKVRELAEVYEPVMFNAKGDILFMVNQSVAQDLIAQEETCSVNIYWSDNRDRRPALCHINISINEAGFLDLLYLRDGPFAAFVILASRNGRGYILTLDTSRVERAEMNKEFEWVEITYTCKNGYGVAASTADKERLASLVPSIVPCSAWPYVRRDSFSFSYRIGCYRHPFVFIHSKKNLLVADVSKTGSRCILQLHEEHAFLDRVAINTFGFVAAYVNKLHIYAITNKWLSDAMENASTDEVIDARPTYVRTQSSRLDTERRLTIWSARVMCCDLHSTEPWMATSLNNGNVYIWDYDKQTREKSFEVCDRPVRTCRFVPRKNWLITGSDDMRVCIFNYVTLERVRMFQAHNGYIRCIVVHPQQPFFLTSSDDKKIKLWDWENNWRRQRVFKGHTRCVMQVVINPKDHNTFASASLDRTIKVWQFGSSRPNFTLEGHEKGVNCVDYYHLGERPYIISGANDHMVKIWNYQNQACVQTLEEHAHISSVAFHPELGSVLIGLWDGTVRVWHATTHQLENTLNSTHRLENTLNYELGRAGTIRCLPKSYNIAIGYDNGSLVVKLSYYKEKDRPVMSMGQNGKIVWAKKHEIQQATLDPLKNFSIKRLQRFPLLVEVRRSCKVYPQTIEHNPNGSCFVVCGKSMYIIYSATELEKKDSGSGLDFAWASDSSQYAVRKDSFVVKVFKNFQEKGTLTPHDGVESIHGGYLLGVKSRSRLAFYDWETMELVRRIEIQSQSKNVYWSENGQVVCIASKDSYYVLRYDASAFCEARGEEKTVDGVVSSFKKLYEFHEEVRTGLWVSDRFIYITNINLLSYYAGGRSQHIFPVNRPMHIIGYLQSEEPKRQLALFLQDEEVQLVSCFLELETE